MKARMPKGYGRPDPQAMMRQVQKMQEEIRAKQEELENREYTGTDSGEMVTAVGCLPYIVPGEMISAEGSWVTHAQHGRQFKIEQSNRLLPTSADGIYEYLAGSTVKGIGPATAALIVDRFK